MIDRILESLKAIVREMLSPDADDGEPAWGSFVPWEFQVSSVTDTSFSGRATSSRCPWPDQKDIPIMPGVAGTLIKPAAGSLVLVAFVNGDPTRPRCVGWDQAVPQAVGLAGGGAAVHRVGDLADGGTFSAPGALLYTSPTGQGWGLTITCAAPGNPAVLAIVPVTGTPGALTSKATTGSSIVSSGG